MRTEGEGETGLRDIHKAFEFDSYFHYLKN